MDSERIKYYCINHDTEKWEETSERTGWNTCTIDPEIQPKFMFYYTEADGVSRKQFAVTPSKKWIEWLKE